MGNHTNLNRFIKKNSSTILTVIGSIGVGITAIISARDTIKAMKKIEEEKFDRLHIKDFTTKDKIKIAAPCYIPTVISGVSTILCICSANRINKNVQKSLTSGYILLDRAYKEYKNSVKEVYGEDADLNIVKNISNKKIEELNTIDTNESELFFDMFSLRFFNSTVSTIHEAEKAANEILHSNGCISLGDVYHMLGLSTLETDYSLGWSLGVGSTMYNYDQIEIELTPMVNDDGRKYYIIDFVHAPTDDYLYCV